MHAQRPQAVEDSTGREHANGYTHRRDETWCEWEAHVQSLRLALESKSQDPHIRQLISECMAFYRDSYTIPPSKDSLLASISGQNSSLLEMAFMWLGGWRPSSAITLVYSNMGVSVRKSDGLVGSISPSCMLSKFQLSAMEVLREQTCQAESETSSGLASLQMLVADQNMAEAFGIGNLPSSCCDVTQAQRLMDGKLASLRTLYMQANGLRLQTLQELQNVLTPTQAAQCIIAAFELANAVRKLGDAFETNMFPDSSKSIRVPSA